MEAAKELFENEKEWIGRRVTAVQIAHIILMGFINLSTQLSTPTQPSMKHNPTKNRQACDIQSPFLPDILLQRAGDHFSRKRISTDATNQQTYPSN
jgi:hypothetical protein